MGKDFYSNCGNAPFMSWQCISLKVENMGINRDVDIIIRDEKSQNDFVKHVLYNLVTLDGYAGSGLMMLKALNKQDIEGN